MTVAHLNGGPKDDATWRVEGEVFLVARPVDLRRVLVEGAGMPDDLHIQTGSYRMRRDSLGQPVPHDLTGTVEYDWQGWT